MDKPMWNNSKGSYSIADVCKYELWYCILCTKALQLKRKNTVSLILKLVFFHTVGLYLKLNHVLMQDRISGSIFNMPQWDHPLPTLDSILSTLTCSWPRSAADKVQLRPRAILLLKLQLLKQWKVPFCSLKQHHQQHTAHFWARAIQLHCTKSPSGCDYFTNQFVPRIF